MNIKKRPISEIAVFICLAVSAAYSLEVNQSELKSAGAADAVVFQNYTGPYAHIDSAASIRGIGTSLGSTFASSPENAGTAGSQNRYYVIHAVDPSVKDKLDADIFIIGADATVDHIDNVRRIIAAYLSAAYAYSDSDASTIATFITVYNAVYRGKLDTFKSKYKDVVMKNLSADKAGIALSYKEWPGNTQMVIPLSDAANGGLSTIDTSIISDKNVVQSMREKDGKGIDERKNMVDIKEREADNASQKAQTSQKQAVTEQNKAAQENQKLADAQKAAAQADKEAAAAQKTAEANPDDKAAQQAAAQKTAEAEQKKQAAAEQQKTAEDQQKKAEQAQNSAAEQQAKADKKMSEAQSERTDISRDQQQIIEQSSKEIDASSVSGLVLVNESKEYSKIVKINSKTGKTSKESPVNVIHGRIVYETAAGFIAIAGENGGNGAVKLVLLDKDNMEITKQSDETVADNSVLVQNGSEYYCIIKDGKNWVLGKFDQNLKNTLKSPVSVKSGTPVTVTADGICVTDDKGKAVLLKPSDLTAVQ